MVFGGCVIMTEIFWIIMNYVSSHFKVLKNQILLRRNNTKAYECNNHGCWDVIPICAAIV